MCWKIKQKGEKSAIILKMCHFNYDQYFGNSYMFKPEITSDKIKNIHVIRKKAQTECWSKISFIVWALYDAISAQLFLYWNSKYPLASQAYFSLTQQWDMQGNVLLPYHTVWACSQNIYWSLVMKTKVKIINE